MNKGNSEDNGQVYEWPQCVYALICVKGKVVKTKGSRKKILIKSFVQEEEGKMRGIDIT